MMTPDCTPESLCDLSLRSITRVRSGDWYGNPAGRQWAYRWAQFSLMTMVYGAPGWCLGECLGEFWCAGAEGRRVARTALDSLLRRGILRRHGGGWRAPLFPADQAADGRVGRTWDRLFSLLWERLAAEDLSRYPKG